MRLKSFFADSIEQALSLARRELGPDAILVNSKRSDPVARDHGAFEVVCAVSLDLPSRHRPAPNARALPPAPPSSQLAQDVSELKRQMERLALLLARSGAGMAGIAADPNLVQAFAELSAVELDADLVYELVSRLSGAYSIDVLRSEIHRLIRVDCALGPRENGPRVVVLAGPPGSGKTTALVKLAVRYGVLPRISTQILSLDTYRIAAADELRSYAAILGLGFQLLDTTAALAQALEEHRQKDLILIDTPGLSQAELCSFEEFTSFLSARPGIDVHLVLSASMRATDMQRLAAQYAGFHPGKLLFTHMDETRATGSLLSQSIRMSAPLSFFSWGQRIPEDLEPAAAEKLLDLILKAGPVVEEPLKFGTAAA